MKGSHLEPEVDAAKSWAEMGKMARSLRNCRVTKSIPSWGHPTFGIFSFMNHQPWLLSLKPLWVGFSLSPNKESQLTQGSRVMFTSVFLPLNMTTAVSLYLFPKWLALKEWKAQWFREASSGGQHQGVDHLCWTEPCQLSHPENSLVITSVTWGFYFMAHMVSSVETIVRPKARVPALSLTLPSRVFLGALSQKRR